MGDRDEGSGRTQGGSHGARDALRPSRSTASGSPGASRAAGRHAEAAGPSTIRIALGIVPPVAYLATGGTVVRVDRPAVSQSGTADGPAGPGVDRGAEPAPYGPVGASGSLPTAGRPSGARTGGEALTEPLTAAQLPVDNARGSVHDERSDPAGQATEPPAGSLHRNLENRTAPTKILRFPLDRASASCDDYLRTEEIELPPIVDLGSRLGTGSGQVDHGSPRDHRSASGLVTVTTDRRPAAHALPSVVGSRQQYEPVTPLVTRSPVTRALWSSWWGALWFGMFGGMWTGLHSVNLWPLSLWTSLIGAVIGVEVSVLRTAARDIKYYIRTRDDLRREEHRMLGDAVGREIVSRPPLGPREFRCNTCHERQGTAQLERVPRYPCGKMAPYMECTRCRVTHEDACTDCRIELTKFCRL